MGSSINAWTWLWIVWVGFVVVTFTVIETVGYNQHGTLSEQVWAFIGNGKPAAAIYIARRVFLDCALLWLFVHFNGWYF